MDEVAIPSTFKEIALGLAFLILIVFMHGAGIQKINRHFSEAWVHVSADTPHWRVNVLLAAVIAALTILHLLETLVWAAPLYALKMIPSIRDAYYYVLENYTTLGAGAVTLPKEWRLLGPIIATSGLFTFGWTTGVLVSTMTEFAQLAKERSRRGKDL